MFVAPQERIPLDDNRVATVYRDGVYTTFSAVRFTNIDGMTVFYTSKAEPGGWTGYSEAVLLEALPGRLPYEEAIEACKRHVDKL